jgi:hypothetical protein|tara:strand:+ start:1578 stop:1790 length:213 start_codon:yes stop_codon:yes gene_type:complete
MTALTKLDKRIKEYKWLSHKVIEGVEALKQENERLKAKNADLLKEWCIQAVECQELEKKNAELAYLLGND